MVYATGEIIFGAPYIKGKTRAPHKIFVPVSNSHHLWPYGSVAARNDFHIVGEDGVDASRCGNCTGGSINTPEAWST